MDKTPFLPFAFLLVAGLGGCSSGSGDFKSRSGPEFSMADLEGSWIATGIFFSYSEADDVPEPDSADVIADGGSGSLAVQASGRFSLMIAPSDRAAYTVEGLMFFENGEYFAIQFDDEPDDYEYFGATLSGDIFSILGGPGTAEYDLDLDGEADPCNVSLEFVRSSP